MRTRYSRLSYLMTLDAKIKEVQEAKTKKEDKRLKRIDKMIAVTCSVIIFSNFIAMVVR